MMYTHVSSNFFKDIRRQSHIHFRDIKITMHT